jgi:hypothetical protein
MQAIQAKNMIVLWSQHSTTCTERWIDEIHHVFDPGKYFHTPMGEKAGCVRLPSGFHQLGNRGNDISLLVPSSNRVSCNIRRSSTNPLLYSSVSRWQNVTAFSSLFFIPRYFFSALHFVVLFDGFFG